MATGSFSNGNSIYVSFYCAGGREGVDTYWRMYTIANSGSITAFDENRMIYPKIKGVGSSIDDYDNIGPGGYWENFGSRNWLLKKIFFSTIDRRCTRCSSTDKWFYRTEV